MKKLTFISILFLLQAGNNRAQQINKNPSVNANNKTILDTRGIGIITKPLNPDAIAYLKIHPGLLIL